MMSSMIIPFLSEQAHFLKARDHFDALGERPSFTNKRNKREVTKEIRLLRPFQRYRTENDQRAQLRALAWDRHHSCWVLDRDGSNTILECRGRMWFAFDENTTTFSADAVAYSERKMPSAPFDRQAVLQQQKEDISVPQDPEPVTAQTPRQYAVAGQAHQTAVSPYGHTASDRNTQPFMAQTAQQPALSRQKDQGQSNSIGFGGNPLIVNLGQVITNAGSAANHGLPGDSTLDAPGIGKFDFAIDM